MPRPQAGVFIFLCVALEEPVKHLFVLNSSPFHQQHSVFAEYHGGAYGLYVKSVFYLLI